MGEVDGLTALSSSSTGALQRGREGIVSLPAALPDHSLLPCEALWSSVRSSTEIQATSTGASGELWIPGLQLSVPTRPPGIPERQPGTQHDCGCKGILEVKSRSGSGFYCFFF